MPFSPFYSPAQAQFGRDAGTADTKEAASAIGTTPTTCVGPGTGCTIVNPCGCIGSFAFSTNADLDAEGFSVDKSTLGTTLG